MTVHVVCDNRLRMQISELSKSFGEALQLKLTYKNPAWGRLKAMGVKWSTEPKQYEMLLFDEETGEISIPRGCMSILRELFDEFGFDYEVEDKRSAGDPVITGSYEDPWQLQNGVQFPSHKLVMWAHQDGIVQAIERYEQVLIRAPTGCITGDAMIGINRAGKGSQMRLDHVVKCFNGGASGGRVWDSKIPTMVRARLEDGTVGLVRLKDAYESGVKEVFDVVLSSGHVVTATKDHRFFTEHGWQRLEAIEPGDMLHVEPSRRPSKKITKAKAWYRLRAAPHHPHVGRRGVVEGKGGFTVPEHRLVAEARLNGITLEEMIKRCRSGEIEGLKFLDPTQWVVHHEDEDPRNNEPDNLVVCSHEEHRQLHRDLVLANIAVRTELAMVESIIPRGTCMTYDLSLEAPHNFLANGVVVHNSGKTSAVIKAISVLGVPALIIMWDTGLLKQWQERIRDELGIPVKEQGLIQGGKMKLRAITLAMQQTMNNWQDEQWERIRSVFGFVGFDEVQRYAARTFLDTADRFDAKYRVGVSADERRKDGKQFLIYSMFGQVRHEVPKKDLIEKRIIHDVEVYVMPTDFTADWYRDKREDEEQMINGQDFNILLDEMQANEERNALAASLVDQCVRAGLPTLTFTHRVAHAQLIDGLVTGHGHRSGLALGGDEWREQFDITINALRSGAYTVGCGTFQKLGVGHDIPTVAAGVAVTPVHNNRSFMEQVKGRICRTSSGKQNARILVLWDRHVFGLSPLWNLKKWNQTVRVWDHREHRWKDIDTYLKESNNGRWDDTDATNVGGLNLFASAQRR